MSDQPSMRPAADPPVTITVTRHVAPGHEQEFEDFLARMIAAAEQFPGHLGANVFRPTGPADHTYCLVFKFDHESNYRRWETSAERRALYTHAQALATDESPAQIVSGLETWFTLPGQVAIIPPPRYKMAIVRWLGIYPLATILFLLFTPFTGARPVPLRTLLVTAIVAPTITYVVMPRLTRLLAGWLYPHRARPVITPAVTIQEPPAPPPAVQQNRRPGPAEGAKGTQE